MIAPDAKPKLPRGVRLTHNEAQGGWVLLAPERVFKADAIAVTCKDRHLSDIRICMTKDLEFRSCPEVDADRCRTRQIDIPAIQ